MHGAHPRTAPRARLHRHRRHGRFHAAGDPVVLRRRREPRPQHRVLGRGEPARYSRLGPPRLPPSRRDVSGHLGRRPLRHRPRQDRRVPQGEGRRRHDRPEVGREPARVRDRRHRRGPARRALPREAVMGAGVLRHDQHRHLRARARSAPAHPDRPAVRLLEGALPAAARDGAADLRLRLRRLLAGHRQPRPVPAGELRCARRAGHAEHLRAEDPRRRLGRRGRRDRRRRGSRGACVHRQLLHDLARVVGRPVLGARAGNHVARARSRGALGDRLVLLHRPQRARRGRDSRSELRRALARACARGRCDRRPGDARRSVGDLSRRAHLPVQGGRVRRADPRERDLGVTRDDARVRQGRRHSVSSTSTSRPRWRSASVRRSERR